MSSASDHAIYLDPSADDYDPIIQSLTADSALVAKYVTRYVKQRGRALSRVQSRVFRTKT